MPALFISDTRGVRRNPEFLRPAMEPSRESSLLLRRRNSSGNYRIPMLRPGEVFMVSSEVPIQ
jgi:hypothetical protein